MCRRTSRHSKSAQPAPPLRRPGSGFICCSRGSIATDRAAVARRGDPVAGPVAPVRAQFEAQKHGHGPAPFTL